MKDPMLTLLHIEPLSNCLALVCKEQVARVLQISDWFFSRVDSFIQCPLKLIYQIELELESLCLRIALLVKFTKTRHSKLLVNGFEHLSGL